MSKNKENAQKPVFSVIISSLNEEVYLPQLLKSLSQQNYQNFEVILVDANSEDETIKRAELFKDKLPKLMIKTTTKRNLAYQRNLGASLAIGNFLVFLDADIQLPQDYLLSLEKAISSGSVKVLTTWLKGDIPGIFFKLVMFVNNMIMEYLKLVGKPFACGANLIVERNLFFEIGQFREDLTMSEDHDLILRLFAKKHKLTILKNPQVVFSLRRVKKEGLLTLLYKYMVATIYAVFKGPVKKRLFEYKMGGQEYR